MRPTSLAALLLLSNILAMVAAPAAGEDTDIGAPPKLAPGQAAPLPKPGPWLSHARQIKLDFPWP